VQQLSSGQLTVITVLLWTVLTLLLSLCGGALAGVVLAGKDLGNGLAATMGALFGPVAATPAVLVALALLAWL
jgi:hypothetical protein